MIKFKRSNCSISPCQRVLGYLVFESSSLDTVPIDHANQILFHFDYTSNMLKLVDSVCNKGFMMREHNWEYNLSIVYLKQENFKIGNKMISKNIAELKALILDLDLKEQPLIFNSQSDSFTTSSQSNDLYIFY